jgi:hypothetical protein
MPKDFIYKKWYVSYSENDGARLNRLSFDGFDLFTSPPESYTYPKNDFGQYETRPVYGYDDCFPTVDACKFPHNGWSVPDHGELCWLRWQVEAFTDRIVFFVRSERLPFYFKRELQFTERGILWQFEVRNLGDKILPFLHVMHPVMPMAEIKNLILPSFGEIYDEITSSKMKLKTINEVRDFLFRQPKGSYQMILLREVNEGKTIIQFKNGLRLEVRFPIDIYPTLGIYWNSKGYPEEEGIERFEFAIEPIPGTTSELAQSYHSGTYLSVAPGQPLFWQVFWRMD